MFVTIYLTLKKTSIDAYFQYVIQHVIHLIHSFSKTILHPILISYFELEIIINYY